MSITMTTLYVQLGNRPAPAGASLVMRMLLAMLIGPPIDTD